MTTTIKLEYIASCDGCGRQGCERDEILCPACKAKRRPPAPALFSTHVEREEAMIRRLDRGEVE